jgi:hypothetical protein
MKTAAATLLLLVCSAACTTTLRAQFLMTEYFARHAANAPVENAADPTAPAAGEWTYTAETDNGSSPTVVDRALTYAGYSASGQGRAMLFTAPSTHPRRNTALCLATRPLPYPCQPQGGFTEGSNVFYTAFLLDLSATTTQEVQEIFAYYQLSTGGRRGCVMYQLSSDKKSAKFSILKKNEESLPALTWTPYVLLSKPILLVVKYTHVCIDERSFGHASFALFVNPDPTATEAANAATRLDAYGNAYGYDTDLRYIAFRQSGRTEMTIGGIRVANSFEDALTGTGQSTALADVQPDGIAVFGKNLLPAGDAHGQAFIYDVHARLLRSYAIAGQTPIDTGLDAGIYLLKYQTREREYTRKIFIK